MVWEEVLVDRELSDSEITNAISVVLSIDHNQIMVFHYTEWPQTEMPESIHLICETTKYGGIFPMRVSFILRDSPVNVKPLEGVGRFCDFLHCRGLVSDDSINPFSWILVHGTNHFEQVYINTDGNDVIGIMPNTDDS